MNKPNAKRPLWLALLLLSALLQACATKSPLSTPAQCPRIPSLPPSLAKPVPPETYSEDAAKRIDEWTDELRRSATR